LSKINKICEIEKQIQRTLLRLELEKARKRVLETEKRIWKAEDTPTSFPKMDDKSRPKNKGASYMLDRFQDGDFFMFFLSFSFFYSLYVVC
jgi:hypothetical protein